MTGASNPEFINQTILAKRLGLSLAETLDGLAKGGYWDPAARRATPSAVSSGLARIVESPLTGAVSMWAPRIVDVLDAGNAGDPPPGTEHSAAPVAKSRSIRAASRSGRGDSDTLGLGRDGKMMEVFIASSIDEFGAERPQIAGILHSVNRSLSAYLAEYDPDGDSQESINRHIESADYFIAIIGRALGDKTALEVELAVKQYEATGYPRVKFFVQKFVDGQAQRSPRVDTWVTELYEDGVYYPREFADSQELLDQVELFFRRLRL